MEGSNVVTNIPPGFSIPLNYISSQENVATKSELETTSTTMYTPSAQTYIKLNQCQLNPATIGGSTTTNSVSHVVSNQSVTSTTCSKYL